MCGVTRTQDRRATAITVINLKGGMGKTHTVWLLAGVCQERGKKLLVIDTDTQANITKSLLLPAWNPIPGVAALFDPRSEAHPGNLIRPTRYSHVDLLPSNPLLATYDLSDKKVWEQSDLHLSLAEGPIGSASP
jgi:chromosome partitioning protein